MSEQQITVELEQPEQAADLSAWLRRSGVEPIITDSPHAMGSGELALLVGAGSVVVRAALTALREWVRARRTVVTVRDTSRGREYRIDTSTRTADIVSIVEAITGDEADG